LGRDVELDRECPDDEEEEVMKQRGKRTDNRCLTGCPAETLQLFWV